MFAQPTALGLAIMDCIHILGHTEDIGVAEAPVAHGNETARKVTAAAAAAEATRHARKQHADDEVFLHLDSTSTSIGTFDYELRDEEENKKMFECK